MKNRGLRILVLGLVIASLAGCGTKTEATDRESESSNVVEVDVDIEDDTDETVSDFTEAEDENIVLYAEKGHQDYIGQKDMAFEEKNVSFVAETDITLYDGDGYVAGYVKTGGNITVTEGSLESTWDRFENPFVEGDYLYILREYVPSETEVKVTTDMLKQEITDRILAIEEDTPSVIDAPTSDMEVYEFRMYSTYDDYNTYRSDIMYYYNNMGFMYSDYMTYAIETVEDDGDVICRIYYKDAYEDWIKNQ